MPEATAKPLLLLVDGHSLAFRSFYAFSKGGEGVKACLLYTSPSPRDIS